MSFTSAAFLFGAILALIPIIIHLIYRRQSRIVNFPSLMYFRLISKRIARRQNIREWIILFLRFIAIVFIAFALANPIVSALNASTGATNAVVIILDDTYSMESIHNGESNYNKAKQLAIDILSSLNSGDEAEIVLLSEASKFNSHFMLKLDLDSLKQKVLQSNISNTSTPIKFGIDKSIEILEQSKLPNKECYVISDFRTPAMRNIFSETLNSAIYFYNIPIFTEDLDSIAISNIEIMDLTLTHQTDTKIKVDIVSNLINDQRFRVNLYITRDDSNSDLIVYEKVDQFHEIELNKTDKNNSVYFNLHIADEDVLAGYVELEMNCPNDFIIDNKRCFAIDVIDKRNILLINGERDEISFDDETFYLKAAIKAQNAYNHTEESTINFDRLNDFYAVVLCNVNVQKYTDQDYGKIVRYVEDGGILIIFPGDQVESADFNTFFQHDNNDSSILPASLGDVKSSDNARNHFALKSFNSNFASQSGLNELDLDKVTINEYFKISDIGNDSDVEVIAKLQNGDVFLCSKTNGSGCVYLFAIPADREWSNLPPRKLFPIMINQILENRSESNNIHPGQTFIKALPKKLGQTQILVRSPSKIEGTSNQISMNSIFFESSGGEDNVFKFPANIPGELYNSTDEPGVFFYKVNASNSSSKISAFSVNPDTAEADPTIASSTEIQNFLPNSMILDADTDFADTIRKRREGTSIWFILAICCLIAFLVESILANQKLPVKTAQNPAK